MKRNIVGSGVNDGVLPTSCRTRKDGAHACAVQSFTKL